MTTMTEPSKAISRKVSLPEKPGYKHTKLGWIPEDWEAKPLARVVRPDRKVRYGIVQAGEHTPHGIPCLRVVDLVQNVVELKSLYRTTEKISDQYKDCLLKEGDIVFALRGEIGKVLLVDDHLAGMNITRGVARICSKQTVDPAYLFYQLQAHGVRRRIDLETNGTSLKEVPIGGLNRVVIAYPNDLPEQRRIAQVLGAWDRAIATVQQLLAAQQERKRGLMQELLTGKRRMPGYTGKWKNIRLGDLFERVTRKNTVGESHVMTISAQHGLIDQREIFNKSVAGKNLAGYYLLKKGEFAYNKSSSNGFPVGAIKRLDRYEQGILSTLYICFRLRPNAGNSDYLAAYFNAGMLDKGIGLIAQEGARNHGLLNVSASDFFDIDLHLPDEPEQAAIAKVIGTLNKETEGIRKHLELLTDQKRGLMQVLLTGEKRLTTS